MKAVKVQYTVKESYVEINKRNIEKVMAELRQLNNPGIKYSTFILSDGKTFVHIGFYPDQETIDIVTNLEAFQAFRKQLKESQPEKPPQAEDMTLVASAYDFFA
jgi:quinol monooxygenase YgiN